MPGKVTLLNALPWRDAGMLRITSACCGHDRGWIFHRAVVSPDGIRRFNLSHVPCTAVLKSGTRAPREG